MAEGRLCHRHESSGRESGDNSFFAWLRQVAVVRAASCCDTTIDPKASEQARDQSGGAAGETEIVVRTLAVARRAGSRAKHGSIRSHALPALHERVASMFRIRMDSSDSASDWEIRYNESLVRCESG